MFTPDQTLEFLAGYEAYAMTGGGTVGNYIYIGPDNGLRHCDNVALPYMYTADQPTILKNAPGSSTLNDISIIGLNSVGGLGTSSSRMYPYSSSPCSTGGSFDYNACYSSQVYFILGVYNTHSSSCTFNVTQTTGMGCEDSFMRCSAHTLGTLSNKQCSVGTTATNTYAGLPLTKPTGVQCGGCQPVRQTSAHAAQTNQSFPNPSFSLFSVVLCVHLCRVMRALVAT